ncbi:MAG: hypothetical protein NWE94_05285, partial [Candidatus Bathyarchaeota archaeon]|nr:hypothetical protein [Candidatus Bathyarchaeota archaeon]
MVQQEIRKKTRVYGTIAILSALVLVTFIYTLGSGPITFPPSEIPLAAEMKRFSSYEELRDYLTANTSNTYVNTFWSRSLESTDAKFSVTAPAQLGAGESTRNDW